MQIQREMSPLVYSCAVVLLLISDQNTDASFIYGQPCSERNTAYLYVSTWRLPGIPGQSEINCVDVTGLSKSLSSRISLLNYTRFFELAAGADTLYADHMNLNRFPITTVLSLPNLETIDMSSNNLTKLPHKLYKVAPKVLKLLLSENRIAVSKRQPLLVSPTLQTLMLSYNGIRNIYRLTFARLPTLEVLYLDNNELRHVSPAMFSAARNLKYLHLGHNYLVEVPPRNAMPTSITHYITKSQRKVKRRSLRRRNAKKRHQ